LSARRSADVVIYAPFAGPLYSGEGYVGGAELQSFYLARALANGGLRVRHILADLGPMRTPDGIEVMPLPREYAKRGIPRRRAIVRALRDADARVYIQRTAGFETGVVGAFARVARRRFVFSASHDADFVRDREILRQLGSGDEARRALAQYRLGLRCAHAVVVQTRQQAELARQSYDLETSVISSFCAPAKNGDLQGEAILWVGSFIDAKDPLALLAVVESLPEVPFWMVGTDRGIRGRSLAAAVRERAAHLTNLELITPRPRGEILKLYERAIAVVNTSRYEGFPNTFLEAWARGKPAVSLRVDPDGVIGRYGLGVAANGSLELFTRTVRDYATNPSIARAAGEAARRYVQNEHAPEVVGRKWISLVERLLSQR
jgi:glycosyltransferase involved in cell wall biosynthesis